MLPQAANLPKLPKRKQEFIRLYVETGDPKLAYLQAGYKKHDDKALGAGRALVRELKKHIDVAFRDRIESESQAIKGLNTIEHLNAAGKNEAVRLQAAKDLIARTEFEKPKETIIRHEHKNLSSDEILTRIEEIKQKLGLDAKDVTPIEGEFEELSA